MFRKTIKASDIEDYYRLCNQCSGTHVGRIGIRFFGDQGEYFESTYGTTQHSWADFLRRAEQEDDRTAAIGIHTKQILAATSALAIGPRPGAPKPFRALISEARLVHALTERIRTRTPGIELRVDQPVPGTRCRCDIECRHPDGDILLRIEVAGLLFRDGTLCLPFEQKYVARKRKQQDEIRAAGLALPLVVYGDELCDPILLEARVNHVMAKLAQLTPRSGPSWSTSR